MIIDTISNASIYYPLSRHLETALHYLQQTDFSSLRPGKYEIDGPFIYATIQESFTKPIEQGFWESHRKYIDIHYVIEGIEQIGYTSTNQLKTTRYDEEKDFQAFEEEKEKKGSFYTLTPGTFAVMMPQDAHMPGIALETKCPAPFKKLVIKVSAATPAPEEK